MTLNIKELAEKSANDYSEKWVSTSLNKLCGQTDEQILNQQRVVKIDFKAGFESAIEHFSKCDFLVIDFYKGRGEHSVSSLEKMVSERNESIIIYNAKIAALEEQKKNLIQRENELQQRNKELEAKVELQRENSIEADRNFQSSFAMISSNLKEALEILKYIHDRDLQEEINSVWDKVDSFLSKRGGG